MCEIIDLVEALAAKRSTGLQPHAYIEAHETLVVSLRNYMMACDDMLLHGMRNGDITIPEAKEEAKRMLRYEALLHELEDLDG